MEISEIILIIASYLVGSLSSAIIVCKIMGLPDPRGEGSGNPGATNVLRFGGKKAAAITLAGDMLKGLLPVLVAKYMDTTIFTIAMVGFAAFIGHLYPVFFEFKGGKGVATMLGVLFGFNWWLGLATAGTWLFMAKIVKISSLSALVSTALAPLYIYIGLQYRPALFPDLSFPMLFVAIAMTIILFYRHRSNIQNLLSGKEDKIGTDVKE